MHTEHTCNELDFLNVLISHTKHNIYNKCFYINDYMSLIMITIIILKGVHFQNAQSTL